MAIVLCSFTPCDGVVKAHGLCEPHYHQKRRGSTLTPTRKYRTFEWRFWQNVDKSGDCWVWTKALGKGGYGRISHEGVDIGAHVASYLIHKGSIWGDLEVDHWCRNKACVKPTHLRLVTHVQNAQNTGVRGDSTTGYKGVHYYKSRNKYTARITYQGKNYNLGYFDSAEDAWEARKAKEFELFTHSSLLPVLD